MDEPTLNTDDDSAPGNLSAVAYQELHERRMRELGDEGLHIVPQEILDQIVGGA